MRIPEYWLGDEASFESLLRTYFVLLEHSPQTSRLFVDEEEGPQPIAKVIADNISRVDGSVGIIDINGPLVSDADIFALFMGAVPYPAIDLALSNFGNNDEVRSVLLNIGTPGGDAVGLDETSNKIQLLGTRKPVVSWSGSKALSAGYWLGSAANRLVGTRMAEFGSIGVLTTHTSIARRLKEDGIDVTVIRGGKYKALGHPAEPLSEAGLEMMKEKTDKLYGFFLDHVASKRNLKVSDKGSWAEGKTFFGEAAKEVGLIDSVTSLSDLVQELTLLGNQNPVESVVNRKERSMPKQVYLSQEAAAAVASGVSLEQVPHDEVDVEEGGLAVEASSEGGTEESLSATEGQEVRAEGSELVSFLRGELDAERTKVIELGQKLAYTENLLASSQSAEGQLLPIVIEATQRMMLGLNQTPLDMDELPAAVVAAQYAKTKAAFEARFRIGRQSLTSEGVKPEVSKAVEARKLGITQKDKGSVGSYPTWS